MLAGCRPACWSDEAGAGCSVHPTGARGSGSERRRNLNSNNL